MKLAKKIYIGLLTILPTKLALYLIYFRGYKKFLHLKKPKYWGEKIQWIKLNGGLEELGKFVDKYEVRNYVEKTIGEKYLNKVYGIYDSPDEIDFEKLPNRFVIKCTNGSGMIIICKNKNEFGIEKAKKEMNSWLKSNFYKTKKEFQYKNVKNRILIEEYLEDKTESLTDYKFYCFNGKVFCYGVFYDRFVNKAIDFYDKNGNKLEGLKTGGVKNSKKIEPYDDRIKKMINLSEKLSKLFTIVRVDFYYTNNKIYFGELTFTDGAGSDAWTPLEFDLEISKKIELKKVLIKKG